MDTQTLQLDIRGQVCPSTLLTTLREITRHRDDLKEGRLELIILTDNRNATVTVPQAAHNMGLHVTVDKEGGGFCIHIRASGEDT